MTNKKGWFKESRRHSLAAYGIKTRRTHKINPRTYYVSGKNIKYIFKIYDKKQTRHLSKKDFLDYDTDGVPNYRDCRPFDHRFHSLESIEQAKNYFGITENYSEAGYILDDGTMLDLSGNIKGGRGRGHIAIAEVRKEPGIEAVHAFVNEGAVRFFKERDGSVVASMVKKPTEAQAIRIAQAINAEPKAPSILLSRVKYDKWRETDCKSLESNTPHPVLIQKFISDAWKE